MPKISKRRASNRRRKGKQTQGQTRDSRNQLSPTRRLARARGRQRSAAQKGDNGLYSCGVDGCTFVGKTYAHLSLHCALSHFRGHASVPADSVRNSAAALPYLISGDALILLASTQEHRASRRWSWRNRASLPKSFRPCASPIFSEAAPPIEPRTFLRARNHARLHPLTATRLWKQCQSWKGTKFL